MFVWRSARRLPTVIVSTESTQTNGPYTPSSVGKATKMTSTRATKPADLDATDRKAVTGSGAPWYVSGAHVWNGTADTLNANPAMTKTMATTARPSTSRAASTAEISVNFVDAVAPYSRLMP